MLAWIFVFVQFATLGLILLTGPLFASNLWLLAVEIFGLLIGVWAVLVMGIGTFNITPNLRSGSSLVSAGPYKFIRHPMYAALLLATLPLIIDVFTPVRLLLWLALLIDLLLKLNYEEKLLTEKLPGYADYMRSSARLIPFIF